MSTAKIVGNRLRRYLGGLLAIGFGATWWSLVPPAKAAAVAEVRVVKPRVVAAPPVLTFEPEDIEAIHVSMRLPDPKPPKRIVKVVVNDPPRVDLIAVPVSVTIPVVPVADPIATPEPEPEIFLPPIRTRSS